ncbi:hypothetical protein CEXT_644971 [Caerostris extrusa]|uniref:Uncharacterized protein n=1 Tax=Caerostris extrusa TaxID=172846 RepID=A0AAV4RBP8_CAEEX|nr:hypothetical protein CEXT_644971 [Caerostris extrusa]
MFFWKKRKEERNKNRVNHPEQLGGKCVVQFSLCDPIFAKHAGREYHENMDFGIFNRWKKISRKEDGEGSSASIFPACRFYEPQQ